MQRMQSMAGRGRLCKAIRAPTVHFLPRVPHVRSAEAVLQVRRGKAGERVWSFCVEGAKCRPTLLQGLRSESDRSLALRSVQ